ncbi:uncharacterized protein LY79DRAFT_707771 [Colletotrichum navitas]|uniref:Uncharacterized protein n=1 Tax=Colletotrichum navitas TaxID=681940 RepID=A0AAD8UWU5_9PEZI|nr:uncharacterized protein LY79DRAFT_707771 [Colletotrichum navitas]KAK1569805.1 hypothetical protein LY79DRAFT_707771 [Colletotrichum navitas]
MQTDISHMIPLDQIAGFDAVWCTDNIITGGFDIHCALPQTSATTVRPLEFPPQIRLVTPERTPGKVDRPFEVAPTTINPPGCVNPLRPPAIDQPDLFAGDPGAMHKNRQHCVKKQSHPGAPCRDTAAGLPASRILFENAPDPISVVPTTALSKPRHRLIALQDQRPSKTSTATRASKAGGAAAGFTPGREPEGVVCQLTLTGFTIDPNLSVHICLPNDTSHSIQLRLRESLCLPDRLDQSDLSREILGLQDSPDHIDYRSSTMSQETTNRSPAMPPNPFREEIREQNDIDEVKVDEYSTHSTTL